MCSEINMGFVCRSSFYANSLRSFNIAHLITAKPKLSLNQKLLLNKVMDAKNTRR